MRKIILIGFIFNPWSYCLAQTPITLSESAIETQAEMQRNNDGGEVIDPGQDYFLNLNANYSILIKHLKFFCLRLNIYKLSKL